jgi:hypothetical protein
MKVKLLDFNEQIIGSAGTVGDFWRWAYSDILSNRNRAIFGEFLVASALGVTQQPRTEWDAFDVVYNETRVEIKTAAYLQSWKQEKLSDVRFDISPKKSWFAETNTYSEIPVRSSDLYVFCIFAEKDAPKANLLDLRQWEFYILPTPLINEKFGKQKSLSLQKLKQEAQSLKYKEIKETIDNLIPKNKRCH